MTLELDYLLYTDFETYYDPKSGYTLSKILCEEYVESPLFQTIGVGVQVNDEEPRWMEHEEYVAFVERWTETRGWEKTGILSHNSAFDQLINTVHYGVRPAFHFDTLSMARALHGTEVGGSLSKLALHYDAGIKGDEVVKAMGKRREDFTQEEWLAYGRYSLNDVALMKDIFWKMIDNGFPESELAVIDATLRMFFEPKFILNEPLVEQLIVDERERKIALLERCSQDKASLMSNPKFAALLESFGVEVPMKISPRTGQETFAFAKSDPGMQELLEHEEDEIRFLAEARVGVKSTINETRAERFLKSGRGGKPMRIGLKYCGAHTHRWSGAEKKNFQNLERTNKKDPRKGILRQALIAPKGHVVVAADSSQIEARMTAWLAGHEDLVEQFRSGEDVYCNFGTQVYGRTITPADEKERFVAKAAVLGLGFSLGWLKFSSVMLASGVQFTQDDADQLGANVIKFIEGETGQRKNIDLVEQMVARVPLEERIVHCAVAQAIVWKYRRINRPITELWKDMDLVIEAMAEEVEGTFGPDDILQTGRHLILKPNDLVLRYPGLRQSESGYSYLGGFHGKQRKKIYGGSVTENVVQSLARDVIAHQMLQVREKWGLSPVTTTHDELVYIVPEANGKEVLELVLQEMKTPPPWAHGCPISANGGLGPTYGSAK